jgi:hypothetical protein
LYSREYDWGYATNAALKPIQLTHVSIQMKRKHVQNVIRSSIGFSLAKIAQILPTLVQKRSYDHPWLGISGGSMAADVAQSTDLPINYIGSVLKKYGVNHGIAIIDNGNKSSSEKS